MHRILLLLLLGLASATAVAEPGVQVRGGLPRLDLRGTTDGPVRVAYLGGSITAAPGWRNLTTATLESLLPGVAVKEINAGLPGTGSDLGACRVGYDVLRHQPDLVFVEFAVNDTGVPAERIERTVEGIVRQVRRACPRAGLAFVYTVSTPGLPDLLAGRYPPAAVAMERVAAHYGIPSLHLGFAVARQVAAGSLDFKAPEAPAAERTFSLDGVHPTPAGHRLYHSVLARTLPLWFAAGAAGSPVLPPPLHADNWEHAALRLLDAAMFRGQWAPVSHDDPGLAGATKALLPPTWRTGEAGAAIEFSFTGRRLGLLGIAAPDSGEFRVTVDDQPPVTATFFDSFVSPTFCRQRAWFFPGELAEGPHRVRVELLASAADKLAIKQQAGRPATGDTAPYAANRLTLCGILTIAQPGP
jgi:lysophospholipase L1-like esterase